MKTKIVTGENVGMGKLCLDEKQCRKMLEAIGAIDRRQKLTSGKYCKGCKHRRIKLHVREGK